jgi:hypothetical protein
MVPDVPAYLHLLPAIYNPLPFGAWNSVGYKCEVKDEDPTDTPRVDTIETQVPLMPRASHA